MLNGTFSLSIQKSLWYVWWNNQTENCKNQFTMAIRGINTYPFTVLRILWSTYYRSSIFSQKQHKFKKLRRFRRKIWRTLALFFKLQKDIRLFPMAPTWCCVTIHSAQLVTKMCWLQVGQISMILLNYQKSDNNNTICIYDYQWYPVEVQDISSENSVDFVTFFIPLAQEYHSESSPVLVIFQKCL